MVNFGEREGGVGNPTFSQRYGTVELGRVKYILKLIDWLENFQVNIVKLKVSDMKLK